ncbi:glycoside hydrolase family 140 protein [Sunxiuqinia elliptica]|uniref:Collagenase-like protein with putative collagen-binding domain n=1 Tax=Sunxiuqinia elliptica TaxID=655355 RepID=A0A4V3BZ82_9BACT|nr:glycoside hydrolase family 140 protein [Sunxiuqinia elliptica]TDO05419.1 collagenase-like protein with putative collagen-binding domain [Sunxiuqinia elliptica]TDO64966.1 collagenase-like protein with putative collagen-binding domain [Sunxiuqinia elliptica]
MKKIVGTILLNILLSILSWAQSDLRVSQNGRYLVYQDGSPFFYLGDTAWELFHRLNRAEASLYLKDRAEKGFTVIQAVVLAEHDGLNDPNAYGATPLINHDPSKLDEGYFEHVDYIIKKAEEYSLHIALLPTWGDKLFKAKWGTGPEIFNRENAYTYGKFIGSRYKNQTNIIWVIGGDRNPRNETDDADVWRALAKGITEAVGGNDQALMTFHPQTASSVWFHQDEWLDFNMLQTSHCADTQVWEKVSHDYGLSPVKPTMDGEPMYEEIPVCFDLKNGYADPNDIRRRAYLSLFAGAHGHTYGCNNIWQMYAPERKPHIHATKPWFDSLDLPGAKSMTFVRKLMESRPMLERVPDQSLIINSPESYKDRIQATRGNDYAFIYSSSGLPFEVRMGKISGEKVKASWYNPRNGEVSDAGTYRNRGVIRFIPPSTGNSEDWVLIVDDISTKFQERN